MLDLGKYAGIVFDLDGTLVDTMEGHLESWRRTCEAYGFPFDKAYMHGLGGVPSVRTVEMLNELYGLSHDAEEVAEHKYRTWRSMAPAPQLIPETAGVFQHYRSSKKIGVGTGAKRESAEIMLRAVGLIDQIDALVTSCDVEQGKPHPDTFLKVAELMGVNPGDCVVFEDTEIGRQAAAAAGMDCFLFIDGEFRFYPFA